VSNDQFWLDRDFRDIFASILDSIQKSPRRNLAHFLQRLSNRG
jgi:hypothetical protein